MAFRWLLVLLLLTGCNRAHQTNPETAKVDQAWDQYSHGNFLEAKRLFSEAAARARDPGSLRRRAKIEQGLLATLIKLHDFSGAEESARFLEDYISREPNASLRAYASQNLGYWLLQSNRFEDGVRWLDPAVASLRKTPDHDALAQALINLGWCYYRLGRYERALELLLEARKISGAPNLLTQILGAIGDIDFERRDFDKATSNYVEALSYAEQSHDEDYCSQWLNNLATVAIEQARWDDAERYNHEALALKAEIGGPDSRLYSLVNAARIASGRGRYRESEQILRQVTGARALDFSPLLDAHAALAALYRSTHQPAKAAAAFESALQLIDTSRAQLSEDKHKLTYIASLIRLNQDYVDFLMETKNPAKAVQTAERSRASVLMERLALPGSRGSAGIAEYQALARSSHASFLAYWTAPKQSYLWFIGPQRFVSFALPGETALAKLVDQHQAALGSAAPSPASQKLSHLLLDPVRDFLPPGSRVVIVPSGPLSALNFEALPAPAQGNHYWIEDATVVVAPSIDLLTRTNRARDAALPTLLLFGDAEASDAAFPKLLYAAREMEGIRRSFPQVKSTVLRGAQATPSAYPASHPERFAYIHFTSHAVADLDSPLDSAIILSRDRERYKLPAADLARQPIRAELVTLSACHSAGARTYAGEGLVGLSWAFLQAGAGGVIAGLGDVSDYSTPQLMEDLYSGLAAGHSPADALRGAKLKMLHSGRYASPDYWAPFQLYIGRM